MNIVSGNGQSVLELAGCRAREKVPVGIAKFVVVDSLELFFRPV